MAEWTDNTWDYDIADDGITYDANGNRWYEIGNPNSGFVIEVDDDYEFNGSNGASDDDDTALDEEEERWYEIGNPNSGFIYEADEEDDDQDTERQSTKEELDP